jgi:HEAT repeat protein
MLFALLTLTAMAAEPPAEDPCLKLIQGHTEVQGACIASEMANLGDAKKARRAMMMLVGLGPAAAPSLVTTLKEGNDTARANAATALGRMGTVPRVGTPPPATALQAARDAIPALIGALKDSSTPVRKEVVGALAAMGSHAKQAVPALEAAAQDDADAEVRQLAGLAVQIIGKAQ